MIPNGSLVSLTLTTLHFFKPKTIFKMKVIQNLILASSMLSTIIVSTVAEKTVIDLIPFSMELKSKDRIITGIDEVLLELEDKTTIHLQNVIESFDSNLDSLNLSLESSSISQTENRHNYSRNVRGLSTPLYSATVKYSGRLSFKGSSVPSESLVKDFQLSAFIGQSKLVYLASLQESDHDFLKETNEVKITFLDTMSTDTQIGIKQTNPMLLMIVVTVIGGAFLISMSALIWFYCKKDKKKNKGQVKQQQSRKKETKKRKKENQSKIELAFTQSLSPPVSPEESTASANMFNPRYEDGDTISTLTKTGSRSLKSSDTIDVSGQVDMFAWKHKFGHTFPFETDLTMITKESINKTLDVGMPPTQKQVRKEPKRKISKQKPDNYLSKDALSDLSEANRFGTHSSSYKGRNQPRYGRNGASPVYEMNDIDLES